MSLSVVFCAGAEDLNAQSSLSQAEGASRELCQKSAEAAFIPLLADEIYASTALSMACNVMRNCNQSWSR